MKKIIILLAAALLLPACDKKDSGGEKAAIETFKAEAKAFKAWTDQNKPDPGDPTGGMALIDQMVTKLKAIKTDGLPADLKAAFGRMVGVIEKMQAVFKDFPKDKDGFMKFVTEKAAADPTYMEKFQKNMESVTKEGDEAAKSLKEVAKKYGIEDLDMGPDKN